MRDANQIIQRTKAILGGTPSLPVLVFPFKPCWTILRPVIGWTTFSTNFRP